MLRIIRKKNKDRYRIQFCDVNFYLTNQSTFAMWKTLFADLSDVEKVQAWVVALSCLRRPNDWFSGERKNKFSAEKHHHSLTLKKIFENTPIKLSNKLNSQLNIIDFINNFKIKAVPESAMRSLCFISNKRYPLIITQEIPDAKKLLQLQISGKRIISINEDYEKWPHTLYAERDHLGFLLHDLIHADHFFYEARHRDGQLGFYNFINLIIDDAQVQTLLKSESFKKGFEYIISDMNSHPLHLFQTLHSLLFSELKNDEFAMQLWSTWCDLKDLAAHEKKALNSINLPSFNMNMATDIEELCINMGRSSTK